MVRSGVERGVGGWHEEFMRQQQNFLAGNAKGKQQAARSPMPEVNYTGCQLMSQYPLAHPQLELQKGMQFSTGEEPYQDGYMGVADSAAFEAAFAQAEGAQTLERGETQQDLSSGAEVAGVRLDPILNPENNLFQTFPSEQPTIRIGSDVIAAPDRTAVKTNAQQMRDSDELSRTAGQLLSSVQQETSQKFQQSQFLNLMRRIRDREVFVQGEELLETTAAENAGIMAVPHAQAVSSSPMQQHDPSVVSELDYQHRLMLLEMHSRIRMSMETRLQDVAVLQAKYSRMEELLQDHDAHSVDEEFKALFTSAEVLQQNFSRDSELKFHQQLMALEMQGRVRMAMAEGRDLKAAELKAKWERMKELLIHHDEEAVRAEFDALFSSVARQPQDSLTWHGLSSQQQMELLQANNRVRLARSRGQTPNSADQETVYRINEVMRAHGEKRAREESEALYPLPSPPPPQAFFRNRFPTNYEEHLKVTEQLKHLKQLEKRRLEMARQEQSQALHPGGEKYPFSGQTDEDRHKYDHWASGGIGAEDERVEESPGLVGRFSRVRIDDAAE